MNKTLTETGMNSQNKTICNEPVIEINNLKKSFGNQEVLKNVSFNLYNGENLVVVGKSGTGKSVLIKCIVGLLRDYDGTINVFQKNVTDLNRKELSKLRQKIGFLFQSGALYDSMTVRQNLEFPLRRIKKGLAEKEIEEKIIEVLEHVGLVDTLHKMPSQLSGGMRKRISLARSIIVDPMIMLYDEPTTEIGRAHV
jgi:phospholipid/cholesterol/gamma-HCH transport system ATP-binding protein